LWLRFLPAFVFECSSSLIFSEIVLDDLPRFSGTLVAPLGASLLPLRSRDGLIRIKAPSLHTSNVFNDGSFAGSFFQGHKTSGF